MSAPIFYERLFVKCGVCRGKKVVGRSMCGCCNQHGFVEFYRPEDDFWRVRVLMDALTEISEDIQNGNPIDGAPKCYATIAETAIAKANGQIQ